MLRPTSILGLVAVLGACATTPVKSGAIIDGFSRAACVPTRSTDSNHRLAWDHVLQAPCAARIVGAQASTGSIAVEYPRDGARSVVGSFGEKSNPKEVRVDLKSCRLYVKAGGSPIFVDRPPMWLLEYDLLRRKEVQSVIVEPSAVPEMCTETLNGG